MERDHNRTSLITMPLIRIVLVIILAMLIIRRNYLPAGLIVFILLLVSLSRLWCKLALHELEIDSSIFPCRLFPGETTTLKIVLNNKKRLPILLNWEQKLLTEIRGTSPETQQSQVLQEQKFMGGHCSFSSSYSLEAVKRGYYRLPPLLLVGQDMLGLFENRTNMDHPALLVYPRIRSLDELELNPADLIGDRKDKRPLMPDPIRIAGFRDYTPDIPARFINWKASAHKDELLAKILEPSADLRICIAIDVETFIQPTSDEAAFEEAITLAASLAFWAENNRIPFAIMANGRQKELDYPAVVSMSGAPNHLVVVLEALARLELVSQGDLSELLKLERANLPWGTTLVMIARGKAPQPDSPLRNIIHFNISGEGERC